MPGEQKTTANGSPVADTSAPGETKAGETTIRVTSLRQLSRDYAQGSIGIEEYRRGRARLLDDLASGRMRTAAYQPPPPPLPARVVEKYNMGDTDPTLKMHRPRRIRGWWFIVAALGATLVVLAAMHR